MKAFVLLTVLVLISPFSRAQQTKNFTIVNEVWTSPDKSQDETTLCAIFSDISFLESELYRLGRGQIELSPMYVAYHVYIEKAIRTQLDKYDYLSTQTLLYATYQDELITQLISSFMQYYLQLQDGKYGSQPIQQNLRSQFDHIESALKESEQFYTQFLRKLKLQMTQ